MYMWTMRGVRRQTATAKRSYQKRIVCFHWDAVGVRMVAKQVKPVPEEARFGAAGNVHAFQVKICPELPGEVGGCH